MKVVTIVGTRPELIKLSRVIAELDKFTKHILVHTGQNYDYELNEVFYEDMGIRRPDYFLNVSGKNVASTISNIIKKSDVVFEKENPEALLVYGDTNSCLAVIPAKRRKIPIFHMEAGNRCFDLRVPEEINRKIVDHLSDINMPLSEHARRYLINEGIKPETIIKIGSPMREILEYYYEKIKNSKILEKEGLLKGKYFLISTHREENLDNEKNFSVILEALEAISNSYQDMLIIVSTHPRTRKKLENMKYINKNKKIKFASPYSFSEYIKLQTNAFCVISDSGTITEESSILRFPAITIRQTHERPEGMDVGTIIMSDLNKARILEAIKVVTNHKYIDNWTPEHIPDYNSNSVSKKVVRIILSYTDYVNRTVWYKN